jgi:hypothetical protein
VYDKSVVAWLEIQGDNYEEQYYEVMDFLANFNIARLVIDASGVGSPIADRLAANADFEVIAYVYSLQSKSELYKHFDTEIKAGRFHYPADESTKETFEFRRFLEQMMNLEKTYSGQHMVVSHPKVSWAHDDYPDSAALMCWAARGAETDKPVMEKHPIEQHRKEHRNYYQARNRITAKRRR